jgi:hypothetical protein
MPPVSARQRSRGRAKDLAWCRAGRRASPDERVVPDRLGISHPGRVSRAAQRAERAAAGENLPLTQRI